MVGRPGKLRLYERFGDQLGERLGDRQTVLGSIGFHPAPGRFIHTSYPPIVCIHAGTSLIRVTWLLMGQFGTVRLETRNAGVVQNGHTRLLLDIPQ